MLNLVMLKKGATVRLMEPLIVKDSLAPVNRLSNNQKKNSPSSTGCNHVIPFSNAPSAQLSLLQARQDPSYNTRFHPSVSLRLVQT